ncbi:transcriptional regulator [Shimazuella sp. AN120528]|uniref:helix-turn-helix transcriptional regulator n=1 Tax=Shimazuella soli TaxID=1892854 RepID=UPI001F0F508D|nr:metalloregulator ArsR/SmtB family transcription factor [Shimazuella soli]MCH5584521.1 transcriptional regulator [Shimazuella soli]
MLHMNATTRQILELIKRHNEVCVNFLSDELSITHMAVRKHLNKLEKDQLITTFQNKQSVGRPVTLYRLTKAGKALFPQNYGTLSVEFLEDIEMLDGKQKVDMLFQRRKEKLKQKYTERIASKSTFIEKVAELKRIQSENGYMVESEEINDGEIEFIEYNCPIFEVANKYKKACDCELSLFKEVLGVDSIERTTCMSDGDHKCRYVMKSHKS